MSKTKIYLLFAACLAFFLWLVPQEVLAVHEFGSTLDSLAAGPQNANQCGDTVSAQRIYQDESWRLLSSVSIGGQINHDDEFAGSANGITYVRVGVSTCGKGSSGSTPGGWFSVFEDNPASGQFDSVTVIGTAIERFKPNSGPSQVAFSGFQQSVAWRNCHERQITSNGNCEDIKGGIEAEPQTCTAPCTTTISWSSIFTQDVKVYKDGQVWASGPSGSKTDANLSANTYTFELKGDDGYGAEQFLGSVTVTVNPAVITPPPTPPPTPIPSCSASPASFDFSATQGGPNPSAQNWSLSNSGDTNSILQWSVSANQSWIGLSPGAGSLQAGSSAGVSVSVNISGLAAGSYSGTITMQDSGSSPPATDCPKTASVSLTITQSTATAEVRHTPTGNFSICDPGTGSPTSVDVTISWSTTPPISSAIVKSSLNGGGEGVVGVGASGSSPRTLSAVGTYRVTLYRFDGGPALSGDVFTIESVNCTQAKASLQVSPTSFNFSASQGSSPSPQSLTVTNLGTATLNWSSLSSQGWLSLSPASGNVSSANSQSASVIASSASLQPGTYSGTITISDPNAFNSPQSVSVSLTITLTALPPPPPPSTTTGVSMTTSNSSPRVGQSFSISWGPSGTWSPNEVIGSSFPCLQSDLWPSGGQVSGSRGISCNTAGSMNYSIILRESSTGRTASGSVTVNVGGGPGSAPSCSASPNPIAVNQATRLTGSGGSSAFYSWSTPGGTQSNGTQNTVDVTYPSAGTKTANVFNGGLSGTCTVNVVVVLPDCAPAWGTEQYTVCRYWGTNFNSFNAPAVTAPNPINDTFQTEDEDGNAITESQISRIYCGSFNFQGGEHEFTATADDGVRVFVDALSCSRTSGGDLIIDEWRDQPPRTFRARRQMSAGSHRIVVLYYQNQGGAVLQFGWRLVALTPPGSFSLSSPTTACSGSTSQINLSWSASSAAASYTVFRNGSSLLDVGNTTAFTDATVSSGTAFSYFVRASNGGGTTDSNTRSLAAAWCVGDITVNALLNGSAWNGAVNYRLLGPTSNTNGNQVSSTFPDKQNGTWTLDFQNGGPAGANLTSITPANPQTIPANQTSKPSLTYTFNFTSSAPAAPSNLQANNTSQCGQVRLTWTDNSSNEQGFHVWREPATGGGQPLNFNGRTYRQISTLGANTTSFTDGPAAGQSYHYIVTSFNAGGESTVSGSNAVGPVFNNECLANLGLSSQVIDQVNGVAFTGQSIKNGDTVKFKIIINNSGNSPAFDVYIDDTISDNLVYQAGTARLDSGSISVSQPSTTNLIFNASQNLGDKAADQNNWLMTFDTRVQSASSQSVDFFETSGRIRYATTDGGAQNQSVPVGTGLVPLRTGKARVPQIREIAP